MNNKTNKNNSNKKTTKSSVNTVPGTRTPKRNGYPRNPKGVI